METDSHKGLATREDIALLKEDLLSVKGELGDIAKLTERLIAVESGLKLIKWIMEIMLAGVISLVIKIFFLPLDKVLKGCILKANKGRVK